MTDCKAFEIRDNFFFHVKIPRSELFQLFSHVKVPRSELFQFALRAASAVGRKEQGTVELVDLAETLI